MGNRTPTGKRPRGEEPTAEMGIAHDHGDGDAHHTHRLGNLRHRHTDDGKVEFEDGRPPESITDIDQHFGMVAEGTYAEAPEPADPTDQFPEVPEPAPDTTSEDWFDGEVRRREAAAKRRAEIAASVTDDDRAEMELIGATHPHIKPEGGNGEVQISRPDAGEAVLGTAMSIINPAAEAGFAITHAEESARVLLLGQHVGNMFRSIADGQLVAADDLRAVYLKVRQMAVTHGLDLSEELPTPAETAQARGGDGS